MSVDDSRLRDWHERLGLPQRHHLEVTGQRRETRRGSRYESLWLQEMNENRQPVARYRTWIRQSLQPPYHRQLGWERYSPQGELLDREIHHSRRDPGEHLH